MKAIFDRNIFALSLLSVTLISGACLDIGLSAKACGQKT